MICLQVHYNLNRILLLAVGLWPYQQSKFTQFQCIFIFSTLSACIVFQLTPLISSKFTSDLLVKVLSSVSFFTMFMIKFIAFHLNIDAVKDLLKQLQYIHNEIQDENEIAIVTKYNCIANRYTVTLTICAILAICVSIIFQFLDIADTGLSVNISRSYHLPILMEYFIDQEKYFYLILLHINVTLYIGIVALLAIGSTFITYLQHTCGMFKIASYRIKHAMKIDFLQNINLKNKILIIKGIICAVIIHREAMKLSKQLLSVFEIMFFCLIVDGVTCLSLNLFQLFQIVSENNIKELCYPFFYSMAILLYMFLANYVGQNVTDHNSLIYIAAYNIPWYRAPMQIQRMILFLLQRDTKEFIFTFGGIFDASMECFAMLVKASVSYFTVIYSTH